MNRTSSALGLTAGLLLLGAGLGGAQAAGINSPLLAHPGTGADAAAVVPAAWCVRPGRGVFHVPGPPPVCYRYGAVPTRGPIYRPGPPVWVPRPYPPRPYPYRWGPGPYRW